MGSDRFGINVSCGGAVIVAITLAVLLMLPANGQTKPERQPKPAKGASTAQTPQAATPADSDSDANEPSKPEEKAFKGMKYRMIGPFRGGRSLTAAGIPGDPTTYYFGATGGGVWKSTDGAMSWSPVFDKEGTVIDREHCGGEFESQHSLCGDGRSLHSRQYFARRWSLPLAGWRQDVEERGFAGFAGYREGDC